MADWQNRIVGHGEESPEQLAANPRNWRIHPQRQQKVLEGAIKDVGYLRSVTVNRRTGYVLDGHLRVSLAISSGQQSIPVEYVDLSVGEEAEALATLDPVAAMAATDAQKLEELVAGIQNAEAHVQEFLEEQREGLPRPESSAGLTDPDDVPDAPEESVSKRGDVWLLGEHRVMCGDATSATDVEELLSDERVEMVFSDPPYGIGYRDVKRRFEAITNDADDPAGLVTDALGLLGVPPETPIYLCCDWRSLGSMRAAVARCGLAEKAVIVWDKERGVQNLDRYFKQHEFILYCGPYGGERTLRGDVWRVAREPNPGDHPTPKPVEIVCMALEDSSMPGTSVADLFGGSGSTLIACERLGRKARVMEIDPKYVDVICKRYQQFTGNLPVLESTGEEHDFTRHEALAQ